MVLSFVKLKRGVDRDLCFCKFDCFMFLFDILKFLFLMFLFYFELGDIILTLLFL